MRLKLYSNPGDFLSDNRPFMEKYEPAAQLNIGNALAHRDEPCTPALLFGRYEQDGEPVLLFGNTAPNCLCLNAPLPAGAQAGAAARELARYMRREQIPISGINAPKALCDPFMEVWGAPFRLRTAMDIMVLTSVQEPSAVAGRVRLAEMSDLDTLTRWMCAFTEEALHETVDPVQRREKDRERIASGSRWLLEAPDGTLLSAAGTSRRTERGVSITAVFTPPEYRGRGYCQFTVASLCREMLGQGMEYCTLFVDKANPISNRVYQKIGFYVLVDSRDYRLDGPGK